MSAQQPDAKPSAAEGSTRPDGLTAIVLTRIAAAGGVTRSVLLRDLSPFLAHKLSPGEWRAMADAQTAGLVAGGLATESRGRFKATELGHEAVSAFLGDGNVGRAWTDQRDIGLVARAIGVDISSAANRKALTRPEGVAALIVQKAFGLPSDKAHSPSRLRAELAVVALTRAFGNKLKTGLGTGTGLPAKAGRLLAGQLLARPREIGSDGKLIAQLAAEQVGAPQTDIEALRLAVIRRLAVGAPVAGAAGSASARQQQQQPAQTQPAAASTTRAANGAQPALPPRPEPQVRPSLAQFAQDVQACARSRAEGWSGSRKAFISHTWQAIRAARPEWNLSEIEFKCMLAEAHRAGQLVLANADLKDKKNLKEFEDSAILYKNTVWHFIRVED
jgi:hypothetical protein